jgi:hypothetical protein
VGDAVPGTPTEECKVHTLALIEGRERADPVRWRLPGHEQDGLQLSASE